MKKTYYSTVLFAALFFACEVAWYDADLGDGYFVTHDSKRYTWSIGKAREESRGLSLLIDDTVLNYAFDSTFILVLQRPWNDSVIPDMYYMNYNELHKAFEASTFMQYWIINKKEKCERTDKDTNGNLTMYPTFSNVYGPYQKAEYLQKRKELGVPDSLILKEEFIRKFPKDTKFVEH